MHKRRERLNGNDYFGPSSRKKRRTEEKMANQLSNFHLSPILHEQPNSSQWFFMQKPQRGQETFKEIEERLCVSSDDEESDTTKNGFSSTDGNAADGQNGNRGRLEVSCQNLKELMEVQKKQFSPLIRTPSEPLPVVLWKPPGDFVNDLLSGQNDQNSSAKNQSAKTSANFSLKIESIDSDSSIEDQSSPSNQCNSSISVATGTKPLITFPPELNPGKRLRERTSEEDFTSLSKWNFDGNCLGEVCSPIIREVSSNDDLESMEIE